MSEQSSASGPEVRILERLLIEVETASDRAAVVYRYCQEHPGLSGRIRDLVELGDLLADVHTEVDVPAPGPGVLPPRLGPYRVLRRIGRGGMGEVYEAIEAGLRRRVAVKTEHGGPGARPDGLRRFLRERRVLARLHHTHIVPIYAAGREGDLLYFAMPFIRGASLSEVIGTAARRLEPDSPSTTSTLAELAQRAWDEGRGRDDPWLSTTDENADGISSRYMVVPAVEPPSTPLSEATTLSFPAPAAIAFRTRARTPVRLSTRYLHSVARAMVDVAEAVHGAHRKRVIHRDLKPSNVMIDTSGHVWVLDFGLAGLASGRNGSDSGSSPSCKARRGDRVDPLALALTDGGGKGTPAYMAPEQCQAGGTADARSDVWGLGVILYELLTLRRAFESVAAVQSAEPVRPRSLARHLPADLEAICQRCLEKDPADRYPTAQALAQDLRRWLRHEPTEARPTRTVRRFLLWSWRNPGWAVALAGLVGTLAAVCVFLGIDSAWHRLETARQTAAEQREAAVAHRLRRKVFVQQAERIRLGRHQAGWSNAAVETVRAAATDLTDHDGDLQSVAVGILRDVDAMPARRFDDFGATALAFDASGDRLAIGGVSDRNSKSRLLPSRLWHESVPPVAIPPALLATAARGPVGFRGTTPVQLVASPETADPGRQLALVAMDTGQTLQAFDVPGRLDLPRGEDAFVALAADTALAAAPVRQGDARGLAVWDARTGRRLHVFPGRARCAAFSPGGALVAAGGDDGTVVVRTVADGQTVATLPHGRLPVYALAFVRDPVHPLQTSCKPGAGWLLAAGGAGGALSVFDLTTGTPRVRCQGSAWDVYAVAFRHDGTLLASTGRDRAWIWDAATGLEVLSLPACSYNYGLAFNPDGRRVAVAGEAVHGPGRVEVWDLLDGRGVRVLRGLSGAVAQAVFSPDGRLVAALTDDWRAAVWDRATGALRAVFEVAPGFLSDNAGLAFSSDGRRFALATGRSLMLWDVADGRRLQSWTLPPALADQLAFQGPDDLWLLRVETVDGRPPLNEFPAAEHPRQVLLRRLSLGHAEPTLVRRHPEFSHHAYLGMPPGGQFYVVDGYAASGGESEHTVEVFELATGARRSSTHPGCRVLCRFDPDGTFMAVCGKQSEASASSISLVRLPTIEPVGELPEGIWTLGPGARMWVSAEGQGKDHSFRFLLCDPHQAPSALPIPVDTDAPHSTPQAHGDEAHLQLLWGEADGRVVVADVPRVRDHLASLGLGR